MGCSKLFVSMYATNNRKFATFMVVDMSTIASKIWKFLSLADLYISNTLKENDREDDLEK